MHSLRTDARLTPMRDDDDSPGLHGCYDSRAMDDPNADLERRVRAGEWLTNPEVAALLGMSRYTLNYWVNHGVRDSDGQRLTIGYRQVGMRRWLDPADVLRLLERKRHRHVAGGD